MTTHKFLFLDIDGVLNGHEFSNEAESCQIKPECVKAFNRVIRNTDALVVLSSSWRYLVLNKAMTLKGFHSMLRTHGVTKDLEIFGTLPYDATQQADGIARGQAILEWLRNETMHYYGKPVRWAAIDDLNLGICAERTILTDGKVGMTETDADQLIEILNSFQIPG